MKTVINGVEIREKLAGSRIAYYGVGDVVGGKMYFVYDFSADKCLWYHYKRDALAAMRRLKYSDENVRDFKQIKRPPDAIRY